ncbi:hypothetical protein CHS0354_004130 [Potamilus streckersoni]|uniref:Tetraspanin n=1 Tax=Potamilus streckersoni TaxID=2493646 RepID=A0AAE0VW72_9BIVA|nr:hypothetical protein CHS0354_004130 [Potamilus streckersoni]
MWSQTLDEMSIMNEKRSSFTCMRLIRICLLIFLLAILVGALAILGIGIWTHETEYGGKQISAMVGVHLFQVDSVMMIAAGSATLIITAIGIAAVLSRNECLLELHIGILAFVSVILFAAGILGYVLIASMEKTVKEALEKSVAEKYGLDGNNLITEAWDSVQIKLECCGAYGEMNSTTSWALYKLKSSWVNKNVSNGSLVPASCCKGTNLTLCLGKIPTDSPPYKGPPVAQIPIDYTLFTMGCYNKLEHFINQNGIVVGTSAIVVGTLMIVEMVLSICVYRSAR